MSDGAAASRAMIHAIADGRAILVPDSFDLAAPASAAKAKVTSRTGTTSRSCHPLPQGEGK